MSPAPPSVVERGSLLRFVKARGASAGCDLWFDQPTGRDCWPHSDGAKALRVTTTPSREALRRRTPVWDVSMAHSNFEERQQPVRRNGQSKEAIPCSSE